MSSMQYGVMPYVKSLHDMQYQPRQFEYHPEWDLMAVGTCKAEVLILDRNTSKILQTNTFPPKDNSPLQTILALSWLNKNPTRLLAASSTGIAKMYKIDPDSSNRRLEELKDYGVLTEELTSIHNNCTDDLIVSSGDTHDVHVYDLGTGQRVRTYSGIHQAHINITRFANHLPQIMLTCSFDNRLKMWDNRIKHREKPIYEVNSQAGNVMVCFSPNDMYFLASAVDNNVKQYTTVDGRLHLNYAIPPTGSNINYTRSYYANGGDVVVSGSSNQDAVHVCSTVTGQLVNAVELYEGRQYPSLYVQSLRGSPLHKDRFGVLLFYRCRANPYELVEVDLNKDMHNEEAVLPYAASAMLELSSDLDTFAQSKKFCDVVLRSNDHRSLYANSGILEARWPWFAKQLQMSQDGSAGPIEEDEESTDMTRAPAIGTSSLLLMDPPVPAGMGIPPSHSLLSSGLHHHTASGGGPQSLIESNSEHKMPDFTERRNSDAFKRPKLIKSISAPAVVGLDEDSDEDLEPSSQRTEEKDSQWGSMSPTVDRLRDEIGGLGVEAMRANKRVVHVNAPYELLSSMLHFINTDTIATEALTMNVAAQLFPLARKYDLPRLAHILRRFISSNMTVANAPSVYDYAIAYQDQELVAAAKYFLARHLIWYYERCGSSERLQQLFAGDENKFNEIRELHRATCRVVNDDQKSPVFMLAGMGNSTVQVGPWLYSLGGHHMRGTQTLSWIQMFNSRSQTWDLVPATGSPPESLCWHTSVHARTELLGDAIVTFGGDWRFNVVNDVYVLDLMRMQWSKVEPRGKPPRPRKRHTATTVGNEMWVYGGRTGTQLLDDICFLNLETLTWSHPVVGGSHPLPRFAHSATYVPSLESIVIIGGFTYSGLTKIDVHVFNLKTNTWTPAPVLGNGEHIQNRTPVPRIGHAAVLVKVDGVDHIAMFGGNTDRNYYNLVNPPARNHGELQDLWLLSTVDWSWKEMPRKGDPPAALTTQAACATADGQLLVWGGDIDNVADEMRFFNIGSQTWTLVKMKMAGADPEPKRTLQSPQMVVDMQRALFRDLAASVLPHNAPKPDTLVTFIVEGHRITCSKYVMAARSPQFRAMLTSSMAESTRNEVVLEQIRASVFLFILRFLYTGDLALEMLGQTPGLDVLSNRLMARHLQTVLSSPTRSPSVLALRRDTSSGSASGSERSRKRHFVYAQGGGGAVSSPHANLLAVHGNVANDPLVLGPVASPKRYRGGRAESAGDGTMIGIEEFDPVITDGSDIMDEITIPELMNRFRIPQQEQLCDPTEILVAADRFHLSGLSVVMELAVGGRINNDNVLDLVGFAEFYNLSTLLTTCIMYIITHFDAIAASPKFQEASPEVRDLVMARYSQLMQSDKNDPPELKLQRRPSPPPARR